MNVPRSALPVPTAGPLNLKKRKLKVRYVERLKGTVHRYRNVVLSIICRYTDV